jgi:hypothetical protein
MKLEIKSVKDKGAIQERLVLQINETCDIGKYFVFSTQKTNEEIRSESVKNSYWFPDLIIQEGDLVILYSKKGRDGFKTNGNGTKSHFFYRNLEKPIYRENIYALVAEIKNWAVE